jgi:type I restriction modification DNA specificity protein
MKTNDSTGALPTTWATSTIGDVYDVIGGGTPATSIPEYWGGSIPWITSADIAGVRDIKIHRYVTDKGIREAVLAALAARGSKARNERGALGVAKFKAIGRLRWWR